MSINADKRQQSPTSRGHLWAIPPRRELLIQLLKITFSGGTKVGQREATQSAYAGL